APALAAGCTVVIKPSEFTPFSALAIGVLAERAGIPAGVINIVTGMPAEIGNELMANETVRKISFTGSTRVGALLMKGAADNIKRHGSDALDKGARIISQSEGMPEGRQYARPVVLGEATTEMLLASEETFGPVAPLFRFKTEDEAIAIANGTPFGLAAYFYTE